MAKEKKNKEVVITNRRAKFEYHFLSEFDAGIMLVGTEVKSVRAGEANLKEAYCVFKEDELYIRDLYIAEYKYGNQNNHETKRPRKLLLKRIELRKLLKKTKEKGYTIVPTKMFFSERGLIKVKIALAQGKKSFDKRESIKDRDLKRDMDRIKKYT